MSLKNPNKFEKAVAGWAETLGLGDHRIKVEMVPHRALQELSLDEREVVYCETITDWTRKEHTIRASRQTLVQPKFRIEEFALDEVLHIALSPLSEFAERYIPEKLQQELSHAEETSVSTMKVSLLKAFGLRVH